MNFDKILATLAGAVYKKYKPGKPLNQTIRDAIMASDHKTTYKITTRPLSITYKVKVRDAIIMEKYGQEYWKLKWVIVVVLKLPEI
jgi:hypothetical protein